MFRLENNDRDSNNVRPIEDEKYTLILSDIQLFKDVNSDTVLSVVNSFFTNYEQDVEICNHETSEKMYKEQYLLSLREASVQTLNSYFTGRVASEYRKNIVYAVNIKFSKNGFVSEAECECAAGNPIKYFNIHCDN